MEGLDGPLLLPLARSVGHVFSSILQELQPLKDRSPAVALGHQQSRPDTRQDAPLRAVITPGATSNATDAVAATTAPSTAQTSKTKPQSQMTSKSAKSVGGGSAVGLIQDGEAFPAPLESARSAAALQDILQNNQADDVTAYFGGDEDPFLAAADAHASLEQAFLEESAPLLEWSRKRLQFFCEKDPKAYVMEDILGDHVSDAECPAPLPYVIDAIGLAAAHTAKLEAAYGYKVPRGLHEVGKVDPPTYDKSATLGKLWEHEPAGSTAPPPFVCAETLQKSSLSAVITPQPPAPDATDVAASNPRLRSLQKPQKPAQSSSSAIFDGSAEASSTKKLLTKQKAALLRPQLECNHKSLTLRSSPHAATSIPIQIWNVSSYALRIKMGSSPWLPMLSVTPSDGTASYDPEVPLSPGTSLSFIVTFQPIDPRIAEKCVTISFGYTRDVNTIRVSEMSSLTTQWNFLEIPVTCLTTPPLPRLLPEQPLPLTTSNEGSHVADTALLRTNFGPMWASTTNTRVRVLQNHGSRGRFHLRVVPATTTAAEDEGAADDGAAEDAFSVAPSSVFLESGATADITITFSPTSSRTYKGTMEITSFANDKSIAAAAAQRDDSADVDDDERCAITSFAREDLIASLTCELEGRGVIPKVAVESLHASTSGPSVSASASLAPDSMSVDFVAFDADRVIVPALVVVDDAACGHTTTLVAVVRNDTELPVSYQWVTEDTSEVTALPTSKAAKVQRKGLEHAIVAEPACGTMPPFSRTSVTFFVTPPSGASHSAASADLQLPPPVYHALASLYLSSMPASDSAVAWTTRRRLVPKLQRTTDDVATANTQRNAADPYGLFAAVGSSLDALSTTTPSQESEPKLLVYSPQTFDGLFAAAFRLSASPKPLEVTLHPTRMVSAVECLTQHENVRTFTLTNGSPRDVHFWLDPSNDANHPGAVLSESETAAKRKTEKKMREIYGADWLPASQRQRDGCRLVFSPQSGVLRGNTTLEVTCHVTYFRVGHHHLDIECYVAELGRQASPSLTIIADSVGPNIHTSTTLLDFGIICVGDEAEARFTVTNHNPVAITFRCLDPLPCDPPRFVFLPAGASLLPGRSIDITVYRQGVLEVLRGNQCYIEVAVEEGGTAAIECRATVQQPALTVFPAKLDLGDVDCAIPREGQVFLSNLSAIDIPYELKIVSLPSSMTLSIPERGVLFASQCRAPLPFKVVFNGQEPDVAAVALVSPKLEAPVLFEVTCSKVSSIAVAIHVKSQDEDASQSNNSLAIETYVSELLWNLISTSVLPPSFDKNGRKQPVTLFPHCPPIDIPFATIPEDDPFCAVQTTIRVENRSGCVSRCVVTGFHFVPLLSPFRSPASAKTTEVMRMVTPDLGGGTAHQQRAHSISRSLQGTKLGATSGASVTSGGTVTSQRIMKLKPNMPSFECKEIDGREAVENAKRTLRQFAAGLLQDGRGCALHLQSAIGQLKPFGSHEVRVTLAANLPGVYNETLQVDVDGLPPVRLPMKMAVRGKPILVDPTTSGLAMVDGGTQRLTLPSVAAGMGSVKRKMRIANRCPRDLEVHIALRNITTAIAAVIGRDQTIQIIGPSDEQQRSEAVGRGARKSVMGGAASPLRRGTSMLGASTNSNNSSRPASPQQPQDGAEGDETKKIAYVTPTTFILPALQTSEITIVFSPPAGMSGEWQAMLTIASRIATTEYNDVFIMDEFYLKHKQRYPAERAITAPPNMQFGAIGDTATGGGANGDAAGARNGGQQQQQSSVVPMLPVLPPLLDRSGLLKDNRISVPNAVEQAVIDQYRRQQRSMSFKSFRNSGGAALSSNSSFSGVAPMITSPSHAASPKAAVAAGSPKRRPGDSTSDDDDDAEDEDGHHHAGGGVDPSSNRSAASLSLVDSAGKERIIAIDDERVELTQYLARRRDELYHAAASCFTPTQVAVVGVIMPAQLMCDPPQILRFPMCYAGQSATRTLRLTNPTRTPLDFRVALTAPFRLIHITYLPADGAEDVLVDEETATMNESLRKTATGRHGKSTLAVSSKSVPQLLTTMSTIGGTRRTDPNSDPAQTLFHLRPRDAVDLLIELEALATTQQRHKHAMEGTVTMHFHGTSLTQSLPCLATVHTPSVMCDPISTWFRPPVLNVKDGRPQPKYTRTITLVNTSICDAPFEIKNVPRLDAVAISSGGTCGVAPGSRGAGETVSRLRRVQAVVDVSPLEAHAELIDDPTRFRIFPMQGIVPPATSGGAPGRLTLEIEFDECSKVSYESKYRVEVDGGVSAEFTVRGDSRQIEV